MADDLTEDLTPGGEPPPPPALRRRRAPEPPAEDSTPSFVRNTIVMSTGTAISRLTGFLRLSAMAFAIGITETRLADAYNVANITPNILYELALGGILTSVVVPVVVEWMQARGREVAWDVVRRLFTIAIVVLSAIALLGIVLAPWIVDLYTVGYPDAQREAVHGLATFFLRWFMPQVVFYGIGAVAAGLLNAHRRFAAPMFAPIANNVIVIATFLIFAAMPHPAKPDGARDRRAAARPRDRDDARRGRDDGGAVALGARDGVPVPVARRDPRRGDRPDRSAGDVGGRRTWSRTSSATS